MPFAGLYKDTTGRIWAVPDLPGARTKDLEVHIRTGKSGWLTLVGGYDPRVARLPRREGSITMPDSCPASSQAIAPMPEELAPLLKEMQESGCVPCLIWKET